MDTDTHIPPNHGQPIPPSVTPAKQYTDGFGIASIILAAILFTVPGLILGIIGEFKAKRHQASAVLSRIGWIANLIILVLSLISSAFLLTVAMEDEDFKSAFGELTSVNVRQKVFAASSFSVTAPSNFVDTGEKNPGAGISIGHEASKLYLLAYTDSADNIAGGTTLDQYANEAYESFVADTDFTEQKRERLAVGTIENPHHLNVIDYKMQANYGISKFVYYDRYIKTNDGFYMLTTWTTPDHFEANSPTMKSILSSFKETSKRHI